MSQNATMQVLPSAGFDCPLCSGKRRDYLFVIGAARMVRCHDCSLIFKVSSSGQTLRHEVDSYSLDTELAAQLSAGFKGRVLQVVRGTRGSVASGPSTTTVAPDELTAHRGYDTVFMNGVLESTADPIALLERARATLRPGGELVVLVREVDLAMQPTDEALVPSVVFTPATLLRVLRSAGFTTTECGAMTRLGTTELRDPRLKEEPQFHWLRKLSERAGLPLEESIGLVSARAINTPPRATTTVSVILPVYNEAATFRETFERVYAAKVEGVEIEIVIVESNSTDGSRETVRELEKRPRVKVIYEEKPRGKGCAVRNGFAAASGDIFLIQDADSEYDVADYDIVLAPLLQHAATFVLGSRHAGGRDWKIRQFEGSAGTALIMNLAHESFTALTNWLYRTDMRDPTTMYKVFRREAIEGLHFRRDRFDFDWELVCKLIRRGHLPVEVPVNYSSRSFAEGKKVRFFRDPPTWINAIVSSRFEKL